MPSPTSVAIATQVLSKARILDPRLRVGGTPEEQQAQIMAWAEVFDGEPVWPQESLDAVAAHYKKRNAFPIMPGDVLDFCKTLPFTSSREHVSWWLDVWAQHPWSDPIQAAVGRRIPQLEPDTDDVAEKPRLIEQRRAFIDAHRDFFVDQILAGVEQKALAS